MKSLLFVFRCCWEVCFVMVLVILGYSTQCHAIQLLRCIHMYMHIYLYIHTYISRHTYPSILKSIRIHLCMHSFKSVYAYTISIISFAKSNRYVLGFSYSTVVNPADGVRPNVLYLYFKAFVFKSSLVALRKFTFTSISE